MSHSTAEIDETSHKFIRFEILILIILDQAILYRKIMTLIRVCVWEYILLHYLPISLSHLTAVSRTPPPCSTSLASGCGCSGCSWGLGPDEAEKESTAVLSLRLPAPSPPPHIMNNGREKYIYLLIAPAPWLRLFSLARTATA